MRENYLAIVWNNDIAPDPQVPLPRNFGWKLEAEMSGVIATSSAVRTQKATHVIKKKQQQENKPFLAESRDFNNLVDDLLLSDRVLGSDR